METVAGSVTPDDIDLDFVPRLASGLDVVTLGTESLVLGDGDGLVALNPTASLIFGFLDGESALAELVDDFAEVLGVDRATVETDVVAFVRELGVNGLLENVKEAEVDLAGLPFDLAAVQPLDVGDELDDFTLPDLAGDDWSLADQRGNRLLLVNWSPGCGYCVRIAPELAALHPLLEARGVALAFVSSGDADANRALVDDVGLTAPVLLRDGADVDPFRGTGTPAAYLLDDDGRLTETMVVGADQVPVLARDLAGLDPATPYGELRDPDDGDATGDEVRGRYLPAAGEMCGPGGASTANSTDWAGTRVYALAEHHVGLRFDHADTAAVLDRLFAGARVNDRRAPDNYSVVLGGAPSARVPGSSQALKLLVRGGTQLVRSRSSARVLAALLQYLAADLGAVTEPLVRVYAAAAVRAGEAVLLPRGVVDGLRQFQPRLAKAGIALVDMPHALVDLEACALVVPEPDVAHDPAVLAELDAVAKPAVSELPRVHPGRYPLRTWFLSRSPDSVGPLTPAIAVTSALPLVFDRTDAHDDVARLAELFEHVAAIGVWAETVEELVAQVAAG
jgi:peroxiredoxin